VLATVLLFGAVALSVTTLDTDEPAAATPQREDEADVDTALLSARRIPYVFSDTLAQQRLQTSVDEFATQFDICVSVGPGGTLAEAGSDLDLAPASNAKLLTAAAALQLFGLDKTLTTRVTTDDDGTLYLIGGGDPTLGTEDYEEALRENPRFAGDPVTRIEPLADAIAAANLGPITRIVADDSHHDDVRFLPAWKPSERGDVSNLSALTINGGLSGGVAVDDPATLAAQELRSALADRGVAVASIERGVAPDGAREVARVESAPMSTLVAAMLRSSDNLSAELLTREMGADGTTTAGITALTRALADAGVDTSRIALLDGSGLAPGDRVPCAALLQVLGLTDARFAPIDAGLPVAGESGTLARRFVGDPLAGVLRAKTGNIEDVIGLSGVVDDAEHLRFAFLANGDFSRTRGEALQAEIARLVAAYPDAPPPGEIAPAP
jgi:D-alanyl-D-alanine carboxypeptidase/D-alanyl-D-alanine-endopeptidase (penicillin-binding protein 4)